jgi:hypothetical protein
MGVLGPLTKKKHCLSIWNGVLLYKELIRHMMDYACPVWRSATRSYIMERQALYSQCLRIATNAPWYNGNNKSHDDLGVPFFTDSIVSLRDSTQT